jgi:hypothetical protein
VLRVLGVPLHLRVLGAAIYEPRPSSARERGRCLLAALGYGSGREGTTTSLSARAPRAAGRLPVVALPLSRASLVALIGSAYCLASSLLGVDRGREEDMLQVLGALLHLRERGHRELLVICQPSGRRGLPARQRRVPCVAGEGKRLQVICPVGKLS